jgi:hypothetical protein
MEDPNSVPVDAAQAGPSKEELEQDLRARAWKDDAFRQEFLTNPKAVLERDYAQWFPEGKIPSELSIKVIEEEEQTIYFVLPPKAAGDHSEIDEIDDQDLFDVSGGTTVLSICVCVSLYGTCNKGCKLIPKLRL